MTDKVLNITGEPSRLNALGGFIRSCYFFKKKVFKFIGMHAIVETGSEMKVIQEATTFGVDIPHAILIKLNSLNLNSLNNYLEGDLNSESVRDTQEYFDNGNIGVTTQKIADDILEIKIEGNTKFIKTSDLRELIGDVPDFSIYENPEFGTVELKLYARYFYGHQTIEQNRELLSTLGIDAICCDSLHKENSKFSYKLTEEKEPRLVISTEGISEDDLAYVLAETFDEIMNAF